MAIIINQFSVEGPFGDNFVYNIVPPTGYVIDSIKLITTAGAITDIPVTSPEGQLVTIPNLRERHRFEVCVAIRPDTHEISMHFRGNQRSYVLQRTSKMVGIEVFNIFNNATGISYKYAPSHTVDWAAQPVLTLAQLQSSIASGPNTHSIQVNIGGYVVGAHAGLVMEHKVTGAAPPPTVTALLGISQDTIVWHRNRVTYNSVTATPTATLAYNLVTSTGSNLTQAPLANLTALNSAIAALPAGAEFGVQIWAQYSGTNNSATLTISTTYS